MKKVIDLKSKKDINLKLHDVEAAKKVAQHVMSYKHSHALDFAIEELKLINDILFFLANAHGISLKELVGEPEVVGCESIINKLDS